jgi:hypothetical protein
VNSFDVMGFLASFHLILFMRFTLILLARLLVYRFSRIRPTFFPQVLETCKMTIFCLDLGREMLIKEF